MQKILRKLGVESAETKPFLLMVLLSFLIGGGIVFADTSANALFLSEFGADLLPLIYILSAALMVGIGTLYARLDRSLPPRRLVSGMAFLLFTVMLLMRIGLAVSGNRWFIAAALVWYRALFAFGEVIFWSAAGAIFTLRQGKRLYGLISTGSVLARIVGFLLTPILVPLIGSANLLYASALLLACAWLLITPIMRGHHESQSIQPATSNRSGSTHPTRYIKLIYTIFFVGSITFYLILITFYSVIELRFTDADAIASFLGLFFGVINITILLTKTLVANWFMQRFGITANLLIRPIILFTLAVTLLIVTLTSSTVAPLFFLVLAISFIDNLLYSGLYLPSFVLLFQPLSKSVRIAVQSITQGVVGSVSLGIAGGIILLLGRDRITVNAIILSVMLLMWITALFAIRREYPKALRKALSQRFLTGGELDLSAPEALAVIRQKLASPHPNEVIYALELLQREDSSHAAAVLPIDSSRSACAA